MRRRRHGFGGSRPSSRARSTARARQVSVEFWTWLRGELEKGGLRLVVLLVPNKYTVYGPVLSPPYPAAEPGSDYLKRLEQALRDHGIAVVNLETIFQARAREELARGAYLYWRDDTHWTGLGIEIAAGELALAISNPEAWVPPMLSKGRNAEPASPVSAR